MTPSQEECIERGGQCSPACTGYLADETDVEGCYIRHTEPLASQLGYPVMRSKDKGSKTLLCIDCGAEMEVAAKCTNKLRCHACRSKAKVARNRAGRERKRLTGQGKIYDTILCAVCKREFTPITGNQVNCGPECQKIDFDRKMREIVKKRAAERAARRAQVCTVAKDKKLMACGKCGVPVVAHFNASSVHCEECRVVEQRRHKREWQAKQKAKEAS